MRERTVPVPPWWRTLARQGLLSESEALADVGTRLAKLVKRSKPFSHPMLSKVLHGTAPLSLDLIEALQNAYRIPPAVFLPRTYTESVEMLAVSERHDSVSTVETEAEATIITFARKPRAKKRVIAEPTVGEGGTRIPSWSELRQKLARAGTKKTSSAKR